MQNINSKTQKILRFLKTNLKKSLKRPKSSQIHIIKPQIRIQSSKFTQKQFSSENFFGFIEVFKIEFVESHINLQKDKVSGNFLSLYRRKTVHWVILQSAET